MELVFMEDFTVIWVNIKVKVGFLVCYTGNARLCRPYTITPWPLSELFIHVAFSAPWGAYNPSCLYNILALEG